MASVCVCKRDRSKNRNRTPRTRSDASEEYCEHPLSDGWMMGFKSLSFFRSYMARHSLDIMTRICSVSRKLQTCPTFLTPHRCGGLVPLRVLSVMTAHLQGGFDGMLGMLEDQGGFMQLKRQGFEKQRLYDLTPSC